MEGFNFEQAEVVYDKFYSWYDFGPDRSFNRGFDILLNNCSVYTYEFWNFRPDADSRFEVDGSVAARYFDNWYEAAECARRILNEELELHISQVLYEYLEQRHKEREGV